METEAPVTDDPGVDDVEDAPEEEPETEEDSGPDVANDTVEG